MNHRHVARRSSAALALSLLLAACGGGGGPAGTTLPAPTITGLTPATGSPAGGALVTISGEGFSAAATVTFGGAAAGVVGASPTSLSVTAPAHAVGAADVAVTNPDGQRATAAAAYTYQPLPAPVLSALSTSVGAAAGGEAVTLGGTGFVPPVTVHFGALQVPVTAQSATAVVVRTAAAPAGLVQVTVTNPDAQASNALPFTFVAGTPPPRIDAVLPAQGSTLGDQPVSITGAGFSTTTPPTVTFGGAAASVVSATATSLTVTTPAHAAGVVAVTVTNADAQAATLAGAFTFAAPPTLASLNPASGSTGGGDAVVLSGAGFSVTPPPAVTIGGVPAVVSPGNGATALTVTTPAHGQGAADVVLVNPDGQSAALPGAFTFRAPAGTPPTVASVLNDATGHPTGSIAGGEAVTLTGTGFAPGAQVRFGAALATGVTWLSTTTLKAVTPLAQPAGPVDVTVLLPGTGLAGTLGLGFTFLAPAPLVAAFNLDGSPAAGGGLLLIRGSHLQAGSAVTFGGAPATTTAFTPGAGTLDALTVIIPPSPLLPAVADGFVDVVVTNPDGQASTLAPRTGRDGTPWPGNFHYGPPPVATGFSPGTGKGLDVTITGAGFSADATGPRSGLQVLFQGPSFAIPPIRTCPNAADPACPAGAVSPATGSVIVTLPSKQLNPGNYVFVVTNFDGQTSVTPGTFVVP